MYIVKIIEYLRNNLPFQYGHLSFQYYLQFVINFHLLLHPSMNHLIFFIANYSYIHRTIFY